MKSIKFLISIFLFCSLGWFSYCHSATVTQWEDEVYLVKGEIASIGVVSPRRVSVANPEVADIETVNNKELILVGKATGDTILTIWDKLGQRTLSIKVVSENLDYLKARIDQLLIENMGLKEVITRISPPEGKIVILGKIRPEQEENVGLLLRPFSDKIINLLKTQEDVLVQIDVQILELSKDATDALGINWFSSMNFTEQPRVAASATATTLNRIGTGSEIIRVVDWSRDAINGRIDFLMSRGKGRVLSRPKLVCLSGKEAEFLVGGQIPIVTTSTTSTAVSASVQYYDYGIKLKIAPKVNEDNQINAKLQTEVSEVDTARSVLTSTVNAPAFSTRKLDTELTLNDGQTVFLAGLIKNKDSTTLSKVPGLSDLPILGALFRDKNFVKGDTELVISLTPTIVRQRKITPRPGEEQKFTQPGPQASVQSEDPVLKYVNQIQNTIAGSIYYPAQAKDAGWEGKVNLKLHIQSDGQLSNVDISRTSGYQLFDDTATSIVKNLAPFPPFPAAIESNDLWVEVPVVFIKN